MRPSRNTMAASPDGVRIARSPVPLAKEGQDLQDIREGEILEVAREGHGRLYTADSTGRGRGAAAASAVSIALALVLEWSVEHREEPMEDWNLCIQLKPPKEIPRPP